MSDFVDDDLDLAHFPKTDQTAPPVSGLDRIVAAADMNAVRTALLSLKVKARLKPVIDLQREGVIADDPTKGAANITIINSLIQANKGAYKTLLLPYGVTTIDKAGTNWSIYFDAGSSNLTLAGRGRYGSVIEQSGTGTGNDWYGILVDRASNIHFQDFSIRQGTIKKASPGQHDHLIMIANLGGSSGDRCEKISANNIAFGKALGDCLTFLGDTHSVFDSDFTNLFIDGYGQVQQDWAASTNYAVGEQVRHGGAAYICITPGVSASSGGPAGAGADIVDGTVHWSGNTAGVTYRFAARSGISFQRGYDNLNLARITIRGIQNSCWDMESTNDGTCRSMSADNIKMDNTLGATANAASFSGSTSHTSPTKYSSFSNIEIRNGCFQITDTKNAHISHVRVWAEQAFAADTNTPMVYTQNDNDGLQVDHLTIRRVGTCGAGDCLNMQGTGKSTWGRVEIEQATNGYPIYIEPGAAGMEPRFVGKPRITFSGATPASYDAINVSALAGNVDNLHIDGLRLSSTGALRSAIGISTRGTSKSRGQVFSDITVDDGAITYGVYMSKQAGSVMEPNPIIQGCYFGAGVTPLRTVDQSDNPITGANAPYAIIGGNKSGSRIMRGTDNPLGNVKAPVGTIYVWENGTTAAKYLKTAGGSGYSGWSLVTVGAAGTAPLIVPVDATAWTQHIADNSLTVRGVAWTGPNFGWDLQDAAGNAAAAEGAVALTVSGAPTYRQAQAGYARSPSDYFIDLPDGGGVGFSTSNAALPAPNASSYFAILIGRLRVNPTANGTLMIMSGDTTSQVRIQSTGNARVFFSGDDRQSAAPMDTTGVHVWAFQVDITNHAGLFATEDQKVQSVWGAAPSASKLLGWGGFDAGSVPFSGRALWLWNGAAAEGALADVRTIINSFGASCAW